MVFASCFYGQSSRLCGNRYSGHVLRIITTQTVCESTASAMLRFRSCDGGRRESQIRSPFLTPWDCLPLLITSNVRFFREKKNVEESEKYVPLRIDTTWSAEGSCPKVEDDVDEPVKRVPIYRNIQWTPDCRRFWSCLNNKKLVYNYIGGVDIALKEKSKLDMSLSTSNRKPHSRSQVQYLPMHGYAGNRQHRFIFWHKFQHVSLS